MNNWLSKGLFIVEGGCAMASILDFPGKDNGSLSWEIRALKNGADQAAAAWEKLHDANGGLSNMVDLWRHVAATADEFGAQLADLAARIDSLGTQIQVCEAQSGTALDPEHPEA